MARDNAYKIYTEQWPLYDGKIAIWTIMGEPESPQVSTCSSHDMELTIFLRYDLLAKLIFIV